MNHLGCNTIIQAVYDAHNLQGVPYSFIILHMVLLSIMLKAFLNSMKLMYTGDCHFKDCSSMMRSGAIWSSLTIHQLDLYNSVTVRIIYTE